MTDTRKTHWETVYETKTPEEVSWTQKTPQVSLQLIRDSAIAKNARIIDVGGGDSRLADHLLDEGFENITVLDISEKALEKAKKRLGDRANRVNWVASNVLDFQPEGKFDLWHDRATFHFLTTDEEVRTYRTLVDQYVAGDMIIGTFSKDGPLKCSGLEIKQYDPIDLAKAFAPEFEKQECLNLDHETPFGTKQNFTFCRFKKVK